MILKIGNVAYPDRTWTVVNYYKYKERDSLFDVLKNQIKVYYN